MVTRTCKGCGVDITGKFAQAEWCEKACWQKHAGPRSICVRRDVYEYIRDEAERRGCSHATIVEEALAPVLSRGDA